MTVNAAKSTAPFTEATCRALNAVVLRISGLSYQSTTVASAGLWKAVPKDVVDGLRELAATDPALAQWASGVWPHAARAAEIEAGIQAESFGLCDTLDQRGSAALREIEARNTLSQVPDDGWPTIAAMLPELLIRHPTASPQQASNSAMHELLSVCQLLLRLRTLETRFAGELERQKREAIYHFAYGLSHELNNPLANIATRGGVLAEQESHPQRKILLEAIVTNAMRGCEMLGDLMLVARPPQLVLQTTRIDSVVTSVVDSAHRWAKNLNVDLLLDIQTAREIPLDAAALREALWALIRNGLEAMFDGGTITVRVIDSEKLGCVAIANLSAANLSTGSLSTGSLSTGVCIDIYDQGSGLSQAALEHCFDPYYSGREAGRGLGLGLSKAHRIVQLHRGQIALTNRAGGGVLARVVLPAQ